MLKIKIFTFNPFQENTYLLFDDTKKGVIVDCGCSSSSEEKEISNFIADNNIEIVHILNTHCHIDHVIGLDFACSKYQLPVQFHRADLPVLEAVPSYASMYGFSIPAFGGEMKFIEEGEVIQFGNTQLEVIFAPGHAPGHVVFVAKKEKLIIGGDVLFYSSIGRTDLPGGDYDTLIESIKTKLFPIGDDFTVYPGHGQKTTIGFERKNNPFLTQ